MLIQSTILRLIIMILNLWKTFGQVSVSLSKSVLKYELFQKKTLWSTSPVVFGTGVCNWRGCREKCWGCAFISAWKYNGQSSMVG